MPVDLKPKISFADGSLAIETSLYDMRLRWLPKPSAEESIANGKRWKACWPEFCLVRAPDNETDLLPDEVDAPAAPKLDAHAAAFYAFQELIPEDVASCAYPYASHQWPVLTMVHSQPLARDLVASNPILAYALANNNVFRGTRVEAAAIQALAYSTRKQRDIAKWLGFPDSPACVKLLGRLPVEDVSPGLLRLLRNALSDDPRLLKLLGHLKHINAMVLGLVIHAKVREFVKPALLHELSEFTGFWEGPEPADVILECLMMRDQVGDDFPLVRPMSSLQQVRRMQEAYERAYLEYCRKQEEIRQNMEIRAARRQARRQAVADAVDVSGKRMFPAPPFPGTEHIVPLTSRDQLREEGMLQSNCVGSYGPSVRSGKYYIYRVLEPERATLSIRMGPDTNWRISELKGFDNVAVGKETRNAVSQWLRQYWISI